MNIDQLKINCHKIAQTINEEKEGFFNRWGYYRSSDCKGYHSGLCRVEGRDVLRVLEIVGYKENSDKPLEKPSET